MCGIAGGWLPGADGDAWLKASLDAMVHRGPDSEGRFSDPPVYLGARRLAIIDLEGGAQPGRNEDDSVQVILNGEIYNYVELLEELREKGHRFRSHGDTEVLAHLYEEEGDALCARLRGMFAFALYDRRRRRLLLGRDRFGKKPLYLARLPGSALVFASELRALRAGCEALGHRPGVDAQGVWHYLSLGYVPQPGTAYQGVLAMPPASLLTWDERGETMKSFWRLSFEPKRSSPYPEILEETRSKVAEAVRLRLRSDVEVAVFLSGGVDSTVVAYEAARQSAGRLQAFTISNPRAAFDESGVAARTAKAFGLTHVVVPLDVDPSSAVDHMVRQYDQPFADSSAIPSMALARAASSSVKVALVGDGGDEIFGGYRRYLTALIPGWIPRLPGGVAGGLAAVLARLSPARRSVAEFLARAASGYGEGRGGRYLAWTSNMMRDADKRSLWRTTPPPSTEGWLDATLPREKLRGDEYRHWDVDLGLLSDLLIKMDIATMAYSLEARSPLLDPGVAEFAASLPPSMHISPFGLKRLLRRAYAGFVPDEVLNAPKRGFEIPLAEWLDGPLKPSLDDALRDPKSKLFDWLDPDKLRAFVRDGLPRSRNRAAILFSLLTLERWLRGADS